MHRAKLRPICSRKGLGWLVCISVAADLHTGGCTAVEASDEGQAGEAVQKLEGLVPSTCPVLASSTGV